MYHKYNMEKFLTITKRKRPLDDNSNTSSNAQGIVSVDEVEDTISKKNRKYDQTKRVRHYIPEWEKYIIKFNIILWLFNT
jgi:hypothetical protein